MAPIRVFTASPFEQPNANAPDSWESGALDE